MENILIDCYILSKSEYSTGSSSNDVFYPPNYNPFGSVSSSPCSNNLSLKFNNVDLILNKIILGISIVYFWLSSKLFVKYYIYFLYYLYFIDKYI